MLARTGFQPVVFGGGALESPTADQARSVPAEWGREVGRPRSASASELRVATGEPSVPRGLLFGVVTRAACDWPDVFELAATWELPPESPRFARRACGLNHAIIHLSQACS